MAQPDDWRQTAGRLKDHLRNTGPLYGGFTAARVGAARAGSHPDVETHGPRQLGRLKPSTPSPGSSLATIYRAAATGNKKLGGCRQGILSEAILVKPANSGGNNWGNSRGRRLSTESSVYWADCARNCATSPSLSEEPFEPKRAVT